MTSGSSAGAKTITLAENSTFPITFNAAGTSGKCGYYNTTTKKWTADGTLSTKTCTFSHLTDFAIFSESTTTKTENAYMVNLFKFYYCFSSQHYQ